MKYYQPKKKHNKANETLHRSHNHKKLNKIKLHNKNGTTNNNHFILIKDILPINNQPLQPKLNRSFF